MIRLPKLTQRQILIVLHDLLATVAAIVLTFFMRSRSMACMGGLEIFLPFFLIYAGGLFHLRTAP